MQEKLIEYTTAKLAKQKGFKPEKEWNPEYVDGYIDNKVFSETGEAEGYNLTEFKEEDWNCEGYYLAPSQSILNKWLRDEKQCFLQPILIEQFNPGIGWGYELTFFNKENELCNTDEDEESPTYEDALEKGLQHALSLIN